MVAYLQIIADFTIWIKKKAWKRKRWRKKRKMNSFQTLGKISFEATTIYQDVIQVGIYHLFFHYPILSLSYFSSLFSQAPV